MYQQELRKQTHENREVDGDKTTNSFNQYKNVSDRENKFILILLAATF